MTIAALGLVGIGGATASFLTPCPPALRFAAVATLGIAGAVLITIAVVGSPERASETARVARGELMWWLTLGARDRD